jgi:thiamine transport system permease protein
VPFLLPAFLIGVTLLPLVEAAPVVWFWIVLAHAFMNAGFIGLVVASAVSGIPKEQIEQAQLDGANRSALLRLVILPQVTSAVVGAGLLVALYSATSFGLVVSLGQGMVSTLETEIAQTVLYRLDFETGIWLALMQTALTLALVLSTRKFTTAGFANLFGQSSYNFRKGLVSSVFGFAYLALFGVFVLSIFVRSNFPNGFELLSTRGARDILNISVLEAALNSGKNLVMALLISFPIAWLLANKKSSIVSRLILIPIGISPVVIGLIFLIISGYWLGAQLNTFLLLPIAQSLMLIPLIYQVLRPALLSLDSEIIDAAKLDGAGNVRTWFAVSMPMLRKPVLVSLSFAALASLGEFGAASFLAFGSEATLSLAMFQLASRPGPVNMSMAMSITLLYLLLSAAVVYLVSREKKAD